MNYGDEGYQSFPLHFQSSEVAPPPLAYLLEGSSLLLPSNALSHALDVLSLTFYIHLELNAFLMFEIPINFVDHKHHLAIHHCHDVHYNYLNRGHLAIYKSSLLEDEYTLMLQIRCVLYLWIM